MYDIEVEKPRHSYDTKRKMQCVYGIEVRKPRHSYNFIDIKNKSKSNLARFFGKNHDKLNTYRKKCWQHERLMRRVLTLRQKQTKIQFGEILEKIMTN